MQNELSGKKLIDLPFCARKDTQGNVDEETGKILQRDFEEQKSPHRIKRQERVHLNSICFREWATKAAH